MILAYVPIIGNIRKYNIGLKTTRANIKKIIFFDIMPSKHNPIIIHSKRILYTSFKTYL